MATEYATFGGGCFWCTEAVFQELHGVAAVESGYAGGQVANPSYEQICTGKTGHAEVIRISFDPERISFSTLLEVFFATHDPTQRNRQGADIGTQYRSVVFPHSEEQRIEAERVKSALIEEGIPVVTTIEPLTAYYPAENYHQDYFARNPVQPYCLATIPPKLRKLRTKYAHLCGSDEPSSRKAAG